MGFGSIPVFSICLPISSFSGGCVSFLLYGVLLVYLLLCASPQLSGGFSVASPFGSLLILWFIRVCSPCGSFSYTFSSAFAALLPGQILWLPLRFRIPSLFLPPFGVRRLPVAHLKLPPFFLSFLSMSLFFGHSFIFWPTFPIFSLLPGRLSLHAALLFLFAVAC